MVKRSSKKQKRSLRRDSPNINKDIPDYKGGKLNIDEICHNCTESYYAKSARRFCKLHDKVWNQKTNSCRKKKKRSSKTKKQKGGALCVPCISPILSGLGVLGAGAAATAGAMTMTSSKVVQSGNNIEREQSFEKNTSKTHKKGKKKTDKLKFYISQKNNKVSFKKNNGKLITKTFNKSKNMKTNIKQASQFYDKKIKYCVVKGYKKC